MPIGFHMDPSLTEATTGAVTNEVSAPFPGLSWCSFYQTWKQYFVPDTGSLTLLSSAPESFGH